MAYLSYMAERLAEMPRILKRTGSFYLHCDPTASHGLKLVMGVLEREQAAMGVYATVNPIRASGAHAEAAKRGNLKLGATEYPRAQLWSIQDYFDNRLPVLPALADPYTGKLVQGSLQMSL